ncbi:TPA: hypothetical protein HA278_00220 [Candidatus Woesearchaeota archaeon]|nr:hypothetical protein [archaeon]HIJ10453.1 hypothetical protein [Candidatus Woesearchaeota archaeon]
MKVDLAKCTTTLQLLSHIDKHIFNFKSLYMYLLKHVGSIEFVNTKEFSEKCPHSMRELRKVLEKVSKEKEFSYKINK